jgi:hypothetical protein
VPNFHFYLLGEDETIVRIVDLHLSDDAVAAERATVFLERCHAVEILRGPLPINRIAKASAGDRLMA